MEERTTFNRVVVGSIPTSGDGWKYQRVPFNTILHEKYFTRLRFSLRHVTYIFHYNFSPILFYFRMASFYLVHVRVTSSKEPLTMCCHLITKIISEDGRVCSYFQLVLHANSNIPSSTYFEAHFVLHTKNNVFIFIIWGW